VETIGDSYMVSSGIPISNPHHAPELADMALTLCNGVTKFKVMNNSYQVFENLVLIQKCLVDYKVELDY